MRALENHKAKAYYKINVKMNTYNLRHISFENLQTATLLQNKKEAGNLIDFKYYDPRLCYLDYC